MSRSISSVTYMMNLKCITLVLPGMFSFLIGTLLRLSRDRIDAHWAVASKATEGGTSPIDITAIEHLNADILETYIPNVTEHPIALKNIVDPPQQGELTTNCIQSVPILRAQHSVTYPCFQIGEPGEKRPRRSSNTKTCLFSGRATN